MASGDPAASSYDAWIGRVFDDRYKLVRLLGEGGMGAVFVAEQIRLRKEVAFKIIRPEVAGDATMAARFAAEAMATAQIDNPHIASAIDFGSLPEGGAYLVTQLARGRSLRAIVGQAPLPWPLAVEVAAQIADALVTAHAAGIVHRDLKPDNIIVGERDDGTPLVTVLDLGIAKRSGGSSPAPSTSEPLTGYGLVLGTPGYMAPEQAVGDTVDARTDLYALGVILWECITGQRLWHGQSLTELVTRQLREPAPEIAKTTSVAIPAELEAIVGGLLARNRNDRPDGALAVRSALRSLIVVTPQDLAAAAPNLAAMAVPIGAGVDVAAVTAAGASTVPGRPHLTAPMTAATPAARADRPITLVLIGCFILGAIALIGVGAHFFRGKRGDKASAEAAADVAGKTEGKPGKMSIHDDDDDDDDAEASGGEYMILKGKKGRTIMIPRRPR